MFVIACFVRCFRCLKFIIVLNFIGIKNTRGNPIVWEDLFTLFGNFFQILHGPFPGKFGKLAKNWATRKYYYMWDILVKKTRKFSFASKNAAFSNYNDALFTVQSGHVIPTTNTTDGMCPN